jgi:hypothetical protein
MSILRFLNEVLSVSGDAHEAVLEYLILIVSIPLCFYTVS